MSKHTPGPWAAFIQSKTVSIDIGETPHGNRPCIVNWDGFESCDLPFSEQVANARLIAEAPTLFEICKRVVCNGIDASDIKAMRDSIERVKGGAA